MKIKIYADGADKEDIISLYKAGKVDGFTTNPTLMAKAGITNYLEFAKDILSEIKDLPISFEVFSDDFDEMYDQAMILKNLGENVFVKIPIMNTKGQSSFNLIERLNIADVKMNITAVFTIQQVSSIMQALSTHKNHLPHIISIFAGRIADTGRNPLDIMIPSLNMMKSNPNLQLLWASPREVYNIYEADRMGCHIITVVPSILQKLSLQNKDLLEYSRETVEMFYNDAQKSGFKL